MGLKISKILPKNEVLSESVDNVKVAINAHLYMNYFLENSKAKDESAKTKSMLIGLLNFSIDMINFNIRPCFVFDGPFLDITKHKKLTSEIAKPRMTSLINENMVSDVKNMINMLGFPIVQAPSEAEAQCAHLCIKKDCLGVGSQDFDSLMFGAPRVYYNLIALSNNKKTKILKSIYVYNLRQILKELKLTNDQLIILGMLTGTDFNPEVNGIDLQNALKTIHKYKSFNKVLEKVKWQYGYRPKVVYEHIKSMPVTNKYRLKWNKPNFDAVAGFLILKYNCDKKALEKTIKKVK